MSEQVVTVKAFTKNPDEGNPAGVVLDARQLSVGQMQLISTKLGFSESAFIFPSSIADMRIRYFSPLQEVDFCGHATIAAVSLAGQNSCEYSIETKAGIYDVAIRSDGLVIMSQGKADFLDELQDRNRIVHLLGINEEDLASHPIQVVKTIVPKVLVPLTTLEVLRRIKIDREAVTKFSKEIGVNGLSVFALDDKGVVATRFFNPAVGIDEDPATGVAAGPIGAYIHKYVDESLKDLHIIQGFDMDKSSDLFVEISESIKVGGYAVISERLQVNDLL